MVNTNNKTRIQFFGGLRTIGGTIVSIEYNQSRVIFDFGLTFSPATNILDGYVKERKESILQDYLRLGLIPAIDGIFSNDKLKGISTIISTEDDQRETAVIISHLHLDHMAGMGLISPRIPVYLTRDSKKLYTLIEEIGEGVPGNREYQECDYEIPFSIGEIKVTPLRLDHDVLGATGYSIQTPDTTFIYSGDLRLHGKHPEWTEAFIQQTNEYKPDVLIMEGTTLRNEEELPDELLIPSLDIPEDFMTESKLSESLKSVLEQTQGIGIINIYHRNIDRMIDVIKAAKLAGRKIVLEPETAYLAKYFTEEEDIYVYKNESTKLELKDGNLPKWKEDILESVKTLDAEAINKDNGKYLLQNSYENMLELLDINVEEGIYIHSNGVPLGDYDPAYHNLKRMIEKLQMAYIQLGSSGHASPSHLKYIIDHINPKILIPLHSFHPERLRSEKGIQFLPSYNVSYYMENKMIYPLDREQ